MGFQNTCQQLMMSIFQKAFPTWITDKALRVFWAGNADNVVAEKG